MFRMVPATHRHTPPGSRRAHLLGMKLEPFALQIYRRFLEGQTIAALSLELGIPADRIEVRIRAAARYAQTRRPEPVESPYSLDLVAV